jgi:hypothetical protein
MDAPGSHAGNVPRRSGWQGKASARPFTAHIASVDGTQIAGAKHQTKHPEYLRTALINLFFMLKYDGIADDRLREHS